MQFGKEMQDINNMIDEMDLINILRTLRITTSRDIMFATEHRIFSIIDHKQRLDKYTRIKIIWWYIL